MSPFAPFQMLDTVPIAQLPDGGVGGHVGEGRRAAARQDP